MAASAGVLAATIIGVGLLTPGYRPLTDAVSRLGESDEPFAAIWRSGFVVYGLLVIAGSTALGTYSPSRRRLLARLIGGFGATAIVAGLAPKDAPDAAHTLTSQVHVAATILGGTALLTAMALVARSAPKRGDRVTAAAIAIFSTIGVMVFPATWGTPLYGFIELGLLTFAATWLTILALRIAWNASLTR